MNLEGLTESEVEEIVEYGIQRGKVALLSAFAAIALGGIMGIFVQGIIFWLSFCSLRRYAGGYHADTQNRCFVISFAVLCLAYLWIKEMGHIGIPEFLVQSMMLLVILIFAPVENRNRILDENEKQKYGKKTKRRAVLLYFVYVAVSFAKMPVFAAPIEAAFGVVAISLIAGIVKNTIAN